MDSNQLTTYWRENIRKTNINTNCNWDNMSDDLRAYEEHEGHGHEETNAEDEAPEESNNAETETAEVNTESNDDSPQYSDVRGKNMPKRILAYTKLKLLRQLSKNLKSSVDGTFKSFCKLWGHSFIWMVKLHGYLVPVVWGWLLDKLEVRR